MIYAYSAVSALSLEQALACKTGCPCLPDPCGLGSDSCGGKVFWGKLLEFLTQTGSERQLLLWRWERRGAASRWL